MRQKSLSVLLRSGAGMGTFLGVLGMLGCKDLTGSQQFPAGTVNPSSYNTPSGAFGMHTAVLYALEQALPSYLINTGLLTDELESNTIGASPGVVLISQLPQGGLLDARILPSESYGFSGTTADGDYVNLQRVRGAINQALGAIAAYDTGSHPVGSPGIMRGELYALQGYSELLLADFFCSGIPLSTLDFEKDFTYHASSTTRGVYLDAIAKLDSAIMLADTSTQVLNLARVLKGRALLALDSFSAAGQAVAQVPDGFQYGLSIDWSDNTNSGSQNKLNASATVSNNEGDNGLPYISSLDPRTTTIDGPGPSAAAGINVQLTFPARYSQGGFSPFIVASGVEARLIQAEAALQAGSSTWLTILNDLRTNGTVASVYTRLCQNGITGVQDGSPCPAGVQDTTWGPGIGIGFIPGSVLAKAGPDCPNSDAPGTACTDTVWYRGLRPLTDPVTPSARVALLFQERAYWLFLTGHRQGDMRRLLRQYSQLGYNSSAQVYPTGSYLAPGATTYGTAVTAPIPGNEFLNPLFHGCLDRAP